MTVREQAKAAVKTAFRATESMWFNCDYKQYSSDYEPGVETQEVEDEYSFLAFDVDYDKELSESAPYQKGTRFIGADFDDITGNFLVGSSVVITEKSGKVIKYTVQAIKPVQQDVLLLARLKPGG